MVLTTDRLIMRDFEESDWPAVLGYQSDARYLRYYDWVDRTPAAVQALVGLFLEQQAATPRIAYQLAITLKETGQLIGNCGIRLAHAEARQADLGYELDPDHWGYGYAFEAAQAVVAHGFLALKVHRVWASCVADNVRSAHLLEKLGLRQEGRLRENEYYKDRWWDTLLYGLIEDEWRARGSEASFSP